MKIDFIDKNIKMPPYRLSYKKFKYHSMVLKKYLYTYGRYPSRDNKFMYNLITGYKTRYKRGILCAEKKAILNNIFDGNFLDTVNGFSSHTRYKFIAGLNGKKVEYKQKIIDSLARNKRLNSKEISTILSNSNYSVGKVDNYEELILVCDVLNKISKY